MCLYLYVALPAPPVSRAEFAFVHQGDILPSFFPRPLTYLMFTLGPFWLVWAMFGRFKFRWTLYLFGAFAISLNTADFTRVCFLLTLPLVLEVTGHVIEGGALSKALGQSSFRRVFLVLPFVQCQVLLGNVGDSSLLNQFYKLAQLL